MGRGAREASEERKLGPMVLSSPLLRNSQQFDATIPMFKHRTRTESRRSLE